MASSVVITYPVRLTDTVHKFTATITAHTNGTVTSVVTPFNIDGHVMHAETVPSAVTAPQDNYDLVLSNANGVDVFGAELNNRATATAQQAMPKIGNSYGDRYVDGPLTIAMSGNNVNGAITVLTVYFKKRK